MANKSIFAAFERFWQNITALLSNKSDISHSHDDRYYTETEVEAKLANKSDKTHNHDDKYEVKGAAAIVSDTLGAHIENDDIHFTSTERSKLSNIQSGAQVNTITGVKGNSESSYRTGNVNITKANIGLSNVDNTADANKSVKHATSADSATSAIKATQDASGNVIASTYETKIDASSKLAEAKGYTDTKTSGLASTTVVDNKIGTHNTSTTSHNDIRDLITGLTTRLNTLANSDDTTLDQMSEIVTYIKNNKNLIDGITTNKVNVSDIVNNLTTNVSNKPLSAAQGVAIKSLIDILQEAVDGKAATSHGTHVTYSTTAPTMDGVASVGSASTVARSDHKHPTDTTRASQSDLDALGETVDQKSQVKLVTVDEGISIKNLPVLEIQKLSQRDYDEKVADGLTDEDVMYLTPELKASPSWTQNDSGAPDYIKNRTHWAEHQTQTILAEKTVSNRSYLSELTSTRPNDICFVTFDGVEYQCNMWVNSNGENCYGDSRITTMYDYETDTEIIDMTNPEGTPFYINVCAEENYDSGTGIPTLVWDWYVIFDSSIENTTHTIKIDISTGEIEYHPLDENFIPNTIPRKIAGIVEAYAGVNIPDGYLLCNGAFYYEDEYPELFDAIGFTYGELGSGVNMKFAVPNLAGQVIVGRGLGYSTLGAYGGESQHTLTVDEMPVHSHGATYSGNVDTANKKYAWYTTSGDKVGYQAITAGGGDAHNNMQPYVVLNYIISTGK